MRLAVDYGVDKTNLPPIICSWPLAVNNTTLVSARGIPSSIQRCVPSTGLSVITFSPSFDTLMRDLVGHDRQPSAFLVYLLLWRETHGSNKKTTQLALIDIAEAVGLSKRGVQDALGHLGKRKLIAVERDSITAVPVYTVLRPWRR